MELPFTERLWVLYWGVLRGIPIKQWQRRYIYLFVRYVVHAMRSGTNLVRCCEESRVYAEYFTNYERNHACV